MRTGNLFNFSNMNSNYNNSGDCFKYRNKTTIDRRAHVLFTLFVFVCK